jgi:integrase
VPKITLNEMAIRGLKPCSPHQTFWDASLPNFGIRVGKRSKTWIAMRGRRRTRITIGEFPELGVAEARGRARRVLIEPEVPKTAAPITFKKARETYIGQHTGRERTVKELSRLLSKHFAELDARAIDAVEDTDIQAVIEALSDTPSEALHAFRAARGFFRWCTRPPRRYVRHSPLEGYQEPHPQKKRERVLSDEEIAKVWRAAPPLLKLILLWGTRKTETAILKRSYIAHGAVLIPGPLTKNGRAHLIPILPMATEVLDGIPERSEYFFPGRWDDATHLHDGSWTKMVRQVQSASGTSGWSVHDLRRTFRTSLSRLEVPRDVAELLMNHAPPELDQIYDQWHRLEEKRRALGKYETFLRSLLR